MQIENDNHQYALISAGPSTTANGGYMLEQQNDDMVEELSHKVSQLKRVTIAIGEDVREQNKLLNEMASCCLFNYKNT